MSKYGSTTKTYELAVARFRKPYRIIPAFFFEASTCLKYSLPQHHALLIAGKVLIKLWDQPQADNVSIIAVHIPVVHIKTAVISKLPYHGTPSFS